MPNRRLNRKRKQKPARKRQVATNPRLNPLDLPMSLTRAGHECKLRAVTLVGAFASVGVAGVPIRLSQIAQGLDFTERIGRSIIIKDFVLCGQLVGGQANSAVDDNRNVFRIAVVSMNSGVALAAATFNVESLIDRRYVPGLRHVYYDKFFSLASPGRDTTGYLPACRQVSIPCIPINLRVNYTSNIATSESDAVLWAWCISDSNAVVNPGFESGAMTVTYTDA